MERTDWEAEWRQISDFLLPGRGIYQTYTKPRKRKLTTRNVINTVAEDALYVLTSGMHGALTSPSRPWFSLDWEDSRITKIEQLKAWLQDCTKKQHMAFHASNFYSIINSFYTELIGFGTACVYVGEDSESSSSPFRFETLTAGEYAFSVGADGLMATFFRTVFMTERQMVERFPKTVSKKVKDRVKRGETGIDRSDLAVVEFVVRSPYKDKPITRMYFETASTLRQTKPNPEQKPLEVSGYYEFPYMVARWSTIGSDIYGVGPGSRALPDIKRLQEMEKAFLMATHKSINPPLNAPARMRGKLNTLPGGYNYYANQNETVSEIYRVNFDYNGVSNAVERVEQRIQRNFFNDIFLTASRDPNASPLKATQVNVQEQEKMLRMGPVVERLQHEFFYPLVDRCFNIMLRKEKFEPLSPELADMAGDFSISLISPLATAQRSVALGGIQAFMGFVGQTAQFDPSVLDNVDSDKAVREYADITGVDIGVLRPSDGVAKIRDDRAKAQAAKAKQEQAMQAAQVQGSVGMQDSAARKTSAEAGQINMETTQLAQELGM